MKKEEFEELIKKGGLLAVGWEPDYGLCLICLRDVGFGERAIESANAIEEFNKILEVECGHYSICVNCGYILEHMISKGHKKDGKNTF
jgi:hypothetical protein